MVYIVSRIIMGITRVLIRFIRFRGLGCRRAGA